jgi:thiol-disulfide isomerase/thioredoxin
MKENSEREILDLIDAKPPFILIYFTNPFCGRCKIAEQFLEEVLPQLPEFPVLKCNVHFSPHVVQRLQVTTTPSFKFLVNGEVVYTSFGIRTKDDLYYNIIAYLK